MGESRPLTRRIGFGQFELDTRTGELRKGNAKLQLHKQPLQILLLLLEHPGELVSREELRMALWPDHTFVDFDSSLNHAIQRLRAVLDDAAENPRFIETLARRGYRFIGPMEALVPGVSPVESEPAAEPREETASRIAEQAGLPRVIDFGGAKWARRHPAAIALAGILAVVAVGVSVVWFLFHRSTIPSAELTQRRLTFNPSENPAYASALSRDGKYLAYSDTAGIHVKLLSTGDEHIIPRPAGVRARAYWRAQAWFPDGTQLLVNTYEANGGFSSTWTVSALGQSARELREGALGWDVSPDGTRITFSEGTSALHPRELWVMGSNGDNPQRVLALAENERLGIPYGIWSPDGQHLAYIKVQHTPETYESFSIETCDLNGANRTTIVSSPDRPLESLCWLRDGRMIYSRLESPTVFDCNFWQIAIDPHTGAAIGKPKRLTQWAGYDLSWLSASADGKRLTFKKDAYQGQIYLAELAAAGARISSPRRLTNDEAMNLPTAWTADSKAVFFYSDRNGAWGIFKQGISQDRAEAVVTGSADLLTPRLSPGGDWIVYWEDPKTTGGPSNLVRLMRIPVGGGVPQLVLETDHRTAYDCARVPANPCVLLEESQDEKKWMVTALDPLKGRGKVLRTIEKESSESLQSLYRALSPEGATVAVARGGEAEIHIRLLSLRGGADREILVKGWQNITGLNWSSDGKGFYCGSVSAQGHTLLYVDLKGNASVLWQNKGWGYVWGVPSPDGRYLAILDWVFVGNVWMLEGF